MDPEGTCTCGQPIRNVITVGGRIRQLETDPHPEGNHVIERVRVPLDGGEPVTRARVLTGLQMPADAGQGYRIHKCPPPPRPGPACGVCGLPMHRALVLAEDWHEHPCCDRKYARDQAELAAGRSTRARPRRTGRA